MAFNAKNLHYEKQEPAFLRRLKAENTSDRHNVSIARPRKPRLETGDDDGPTIVDEQGENVTDKECQDLLRGKTRGASVSEHTSTAGRPDPVPESQCPSPDKIDDRTREPDKRHAGIDRGPKKRKQVKAVAAEPEPEGLKAENGSSNAKVEDEPKTNVKSKRKKIKLSFEEPDT